MTITIPAWIICAAFWLFALTVAGLVVWLAAEFWIAAINRLAIWFGLHRELMTYMLNRKRIRKWLAETDPRKVVRP